MEGTIGGSVTIQEDILGEYGLTFDNLTGETHIINEVKPALLNGEVNQDASGKDKVV
jgi:hypothetical protein